jgi:DNA-binding transcriptional LysR family regulator
MNLRALRMFVATADSGSLGRACVQLNVSQPAASRQIHTLETELGVPLFHRAGRQLQLTSAGHDLLRRSRRLLADADLLTEEARALKEGRKGTLKIGATPQLMTVLLTSFLPRHQRRRPGLKFSLLNEAERASGFSCSREVRLIWRSCRPVMPAIRGGCYSQFMCWLCCRERIDSGGARLLMLWRSLTNRSLFCSVNLVHVRALMPRVRWRR